MKELEKITKNSIKEYNEALLELCEALERLAKSNKEKDEVHQKVVSGWNEFVSKYNRYATSRPDKGDTLPYIDEYPKLCAECSYEARNKKEEEHHKEVGCENHLVRRAG